MELVDGGAEGTLDYMHNDYKLYNDGSVFVFPACYFGVYERSYGLIGFEQYMMEMADRPNLIHELMEKMANYKVQLAKKLVEQASMKTIIAGSINSIARIQEIHAVHPWAFTIGSAFFTDQFVSGGGFRANLEKVLEVMDSL